MRKLNIKASAVVHPKLTAEIIAVIGLIILAIISPGLFLAMD
jgi:hypothetical protein